MNLIAAFALSGIDYLALGGYSKKNGEKLLLVVSNSFEVTNIIFLQSVAMATIFSLHVFGLLLYLRGAFISLESLLTDINNG